MAPRTRSRIVVPVIIVALIAAVREYSIRCHEADLHAWPTPEGAAPASGPNGS